MCSVNIGFKSPAQLRHSPLTTETDSMPMNSLIMISTHWQTGKLILVVIKLVMVSNKIRVTTKFGVSFHEKYFSIFYKT